jgi:hypothetical protein
MWMWYVYFLSLFHIHYPLHSTLATFIASQNTDVQSTSSTSKVTQMPPTTTTRFISRCRDVSRVQGEGGVRASLINIYLSVCENHEKNTLHSTFLVCSTLNLLVIPGEVFDCSSFHSSVIGRPPPSSAMANFCD